MKTSPKLREVIGAVMRRSEERKSRPEQLARARSVAQRRAHGTARPFHRVKKRRYRRVELAQREHALHAHEPLRGDEHDEAAASTPAPCALTQESDVPSVSRDRAAEAVRIRGSASDAD